MVSEKPNPAILNARSNQVFQAMAMLAGMQLDIFTALDDGPLDEVAIAQKLEVDQSRLGRLLHALVGIELLTVENGLFANSPIADQFLVRGKPRFMGSVHELWSDLWSATLNTAESVRAGEPKARHDFEKMTRDDMSTFLRGLHAGAVAAGKVLAAEFDLQNCNHLLDVGGGSGGLAIGACEAMPELRATVAEFAQVAPITSEFITDAGMVDRIDVVEADLTQQVVTGTFDVAILRHLLQTLSADQARSVINNVSKAITPGGQIHILGWMLEDSRLAPTAALNFDIVFLNVYDEGAAYSIGEQCAWLEAAGFSDFQFGPAPAGSVPPGCMFISARKD